MKNQMISTFFQPSSLLRALGFSAEAEALYHAMGEPDVMTVERENISTPLLRALQAHCPVHPNPDAVSHCQNRLRERRLLQSLDIDVAPFAEAYNRDDVTLVDISGSGIDEITENGVRAGGKEYEVDAIVTATGFNMNMMGDIAFAIDGKPLDFHDTVTFRGMMFTGVPNLAWVFGYFRASWTLRSELVAEFVCRLLKHMQQTGAKSVEPALRAHEKDMPLSGWMDEESFNPNYLKRAQALLPKRGNTRDWQHTQDYWREKDEFPAIDLEDEVFVYRWGTRSNVAAE